MPLNVDLEASLDELCAEVLRPWEALADDEQLELGDFEDALRTLDGHETKLRAIRIYDDRRERISADELRRLLSFPVVAALEVLMLPRCHLGPESGEVLVAAALPKLRLLDVRETALGDAGARALASSGLADRLEHLSIAGAFLGAAGLQALLDSPLGRREGSLHVEEEGQPESLIATLASRLYELAKGDAAMAERAFARLLRHPALTAESRDALRHQWDLVRQG